MPKTPDPCSTTLSPLAAALEAAVRAGAISAEAAISMLNRARLDDLAIFRAESLRSGALDQPPKQTKPPAPAPTKPFRSIASKPKARLAFNMKKLEDLRAFASSKGGACLSQEYKNSGVKVEFRCAAGHAWSAKPGPALCYGTWCQKCALETNRQGRTKDSPPKTPKATPVAAVEAPWLEQALAKHAPMIKAEGHMAFAIRKLAELQAFAAAKGGSCLCREYVNGSTKIEFQCAQGHAWSALPGNTLGKGAWCAKCAAVARGAARRANRPAPPAGAEPSPQPRGRPRKTAFVESMLIKRPRITLPLLSELVKEKHGGRVKSDSMMPSTREMVFECRHGHEFFMSYHAVVTHGKWCPQCAAMDPSPAKRRGRPRDESLRDSILSAAMLLDDDEGKARGDVDQS